MLLGAADIGSLSTAQKGCALQRQASKWWSHWAIHALLRCSWQAVAARQKGRGVRAYLLLLRADSAALCMLQLLLEPVDLTLQVRIMFR